MVSGQNVHTRPLIEEVEGDNPTKTEIATVEVMENLENIETSRGTMYE